MAYILKKRIKARTYYYLAETQRVKGKPRIVWQRYLGTAERIQERWEATAVEERIEEIETFELGSVAAIESIERELRFQEIVDGIVPKRNQGMSVRQYLYLIALNRAVEPKSKASLGTGLRKTAIGEYRAVDWAGLDSANFWDHMEKVRKEQVEAIGDTGFDSSALAFSTPQKRFSPFVIQKADEFPDIIALINILGNLTRHFPDSTAPINNNIVLHITDLP
jgi:hypothetical protein